MLNLSGTGSFPGLPQGPHLNIRKKPIIDPFIKPNLSIASYVYCEHEGWYIQTLKLTYLAQKE